MMRVIQAPLPTRGYAAHALANTANVALSALTWLDRDGNSITWDRLLQEGAKFVQVRSDQSLSYVTTGQTPTGSSGAGSLGFAMDANEPLWIDAEELSRVKFLNTSGGSANLYAEAYA